MTKETIIILLSGVIVGGLIGALMGYFGKCSSGSCPLTANPFRGAIYGMVMGLLFAYSIGARHAPANDKEKTQAVIHLDSISMFEETVATADAPVLVDFFSHSCPPCRRLNPIITELAETYQGRALVYKVNVNDTYGLAQKYAIRGVPSVLFFLDGKEVERFVGLMPKTAYINQMDKLLSQTTNTKEN